MQTDFVLVDFENVQPTDFASLNGHSYHIKIFLGAQQARVPVAMAQALQALGRQAEYIQIEGNGNNAVDFHIAYYIGRLAARQPAARFHVVSRDTGFDPLLEHLKQQKIVCRRVTSLATLASQKRGRLPDAGLVSAAIDNLAKRKSAKPRKAKTLRTSLQALRRIPLTEDEVDALIEQLIARGVLRISDGNVTYQDAL